MNDGDIGGYAESASAVPSVFQAETFLEVSPLLGASTWRSAAGKRGELGDHGVMGRDHKDHPGDVGGSGDLLGGGSLVALSGKDI